MTNTTDNSCTDAITDKAILAKAKPRAYSPRGADVEHYDFSEQELITFVRDILAEPPVGQPAAAPIDGMPPAVWWINHGSHGQITTRSDEAEGARDAGLSVKEYQAIHAPSPADDRAAWAFRLLEIAEPILEAAAHGQAVTVAAGDLVRQVRAFLPAGTQARATSANDTEAEQTDESSKIEQLIGSLIENASALRYANLFLEIAGSMETAAGLLRSITAQAAKAVAYIAKSDLNKIQRDRTFHVNVIGVCKGRFNTALFAGPQLTHADTQARLTAALRLAREELSYIEWENDPPTRITDLFSTIDALLTAQQERPTSNAARAVACTKSPDRDTKDLPSEGA
ncbi:hypothetical protein WT27_13295 [Burkholderia territorii]|uniref:Uncharacterized protein n=1 Tax=Burkholderia territorii TaxID=1503055 RepID=A0A106DRD2_9BURK|nr:hypothetical protein [Burkholderia territorii]KVV40897.1 hypothetical protein WT27_13295 [Burkholderia territorii]KVX33844.1 hypothetical protein WT31_09195 [Burkholderia territorii]